jgi:hypothetical protein
VSNQLKKMMDRVVQVNVDGIDLTSLVAYAEPTCYMYKLRPGRYSSEYGLCL